MKFALNHRHRFDRPIDAYICSFFLFAIMMFIEVVNFGMILQTSDLNNLIQNVTCLVIIAEADVLLYSTLKDEVMKDMITQETFQAVALQIARTTSEKLVDFGEGEAPIEDDSLVQWKTEHPVETEKPQFSINSKSNTAMGNLLAKAMTDQVEQKKKDMGFYKREPGVEGAPIFREYPDLPKTMYFPMSERTFGEKIAFCFYKLLRAIYVPWFYFMPSFFFFGQYFVPYLS
jgi:hypothetical protein